MRKTKDKQTRDPAPRADANARDTGNATMENFGARFALEGERSSYNVISGICLATP